MPKPKFDDIDLCKVVASAVNTFVGEENIEIISQIPNTPQMVSADKELMIRVCNNLIKNAMQAIPMNTEGRVAVMLRSVDNEVELLIEDNGVGIDDEMIDKIFVPNFTTKSTGTGLGLAMVKQIVESHDGTIEFDSKPGKTIFKVKLPKQQ
jgi:signal transduction histidine kinase